MRLPLPFLNRPNDLSISNTARFSDIRLSANNARNVTVLLLTFLPLDPDVRLRPAGRLDLSCLPESDHQSAGHDQDAPKQNEKSRPSAKSEVIDHLPDDKERGDVESHHLANSNGARLSDAP